MTKVEVIIERHTNWDHYVIPIPEEWSRKVDHARGDVADMVDATPGVRLDFIDPKPAARTLGLTFAYTHYANIPNLQNLIQEVVKVGFREFGEVDYNIQLVR